MHVRSPPYFHTSYDTGENKRRNLPSYEMSHYQETEEEYIEEISYEIYFFKIDKFYTS